MRSTLAPGTAAASTNGCSSSPGNGVWISFAANFHQGSYGLGADQGVPPGHDWATPQAGGAYQADVSPVSKPSAKISAAILKALSLSIAAT